MKNQSKPRIKLTVRTETVRALSASQLTDVGGGNAPNTLPTQPKYTTWCSVAICA